MINIQVIWYLFLPKHSPSLPWWSGIWVLIAVFLNPTFFKQILAFQTLGQEKFREEWGPNLVLLPTFPKRINNSFSNWNIKIIYLTRSTKSGEKKIPSFPFLFPFTTSSPSLKLKPDFFRSWKIDIKMDNRKLHLELVLSLLNFLSLNWNYPCSNNKRHKFTYI